MRQMKVRDVMTTPVVTVTPETTFAGVVTALLDHDISGVPVVDDHKRLVGLVTEADLMCKQAYGYRQRRLARGHGCRPRWARKATALTAGGLMTPGPDTVAPDDTVRFAAQRMVEGGHRRLVVIDDGAVVGVVSRSDLLRRYGRPDTEIANDVRRLLADPFRVPEDHAIQPTIDAGVVVLDGTVRRHTDIEIAEAEVAALPGVVAVDNHLHAREHRPIAPPLRRW